MIVFKVLVLLGLKKLMFLTMNHALLLCVIGCAEAVQIPQTETSRVVARPKWTNLHNLTILRRNIAIRVYEPALWLSTAYPSEKLTNQKWINSDIIGTLVNTVSLRQRMSDFQGTLTTSPAQTSTNKKWR